MTTSTEFITRVVVGEGTPFAINHMTTTRRVETQDGDAVVAPLSVGRSGKGWATEEGALNYARGLQKIRFPGEDIFLVVERVFPEGDLPPVYRYFVAGPMPVDTFSRWTEEG